MKYIEKSLLKSSLPRSLPYATINTEISCQKCNKYLNEILHRLVPDDRAWFRQCLLEIERFDGHIILERFLRLYRVSIVDRNIRGMTKT